MKTVHSALRAASGVLLFAFGCSHASVRTTDRPLDRSPGGATVVFVRPPKAVGALMSPYLFDGTRQLVLGQAINDSWFALELPPGEYRLCAAPAPQQAATSFPPDSQRSTGFSSPISRLVLEPGKTTFVRVDVGWESFASPRIELVPLRPGSASEQRARELTTATRRVELEPNAPDLAIVSAPDNLRARFDACFSASSDDLRLSSRTD